MVQKSTRVVRTSNKAREPQPILKSDPGQKLSVALGGPSVLLLVRDFCSLLGCNLMLTVSLGKKDQSEGRLLILSTG